MQPPRAKPANSANSANFPNPAPAQNPATPPTPPTPRIADETSANPDAPTVVTPPLHAQPGPFGSAPARLGKASQQATQQGKTLWSNFRSMPRIAQVLMAVGAALSLMVCSCCSCSGLAGSLGGGPTTAQSTATTSSHKSSNSSTVLVSMATATPTSSHKLSAAQKQQVSDYLNAGLSHYVDAWHQGQRVLGTTQYADAWAGLRAMGDPNSAASKFSAWRNSSGIEFDETTYINAFNSADALYTADNEPQALLQYQDDMGTLQADIATWIEDAVGWQIRTTATATMTQDVQTIKTDVSQVQSDITATIAAS